MEKREISLEPKHWEYIENLATLVCKTIPEFILHAVFEYQNPDKETNKKVDWEAFDEFWNVYPRKEAKKPAKEIWRRINPRPELAKKIVEDVKKRKWKEGFIPMARTYLGQRRWEDEGNKASPQVVDNSVDAVKAREAAKKLREKYGLS